MPHYHNPIPRLTQSIREFMEITETAAVTYQQIDTGTKAKPSAEFRFNLYTTPEHYESALKSRFVAVARELEAEIADRYSKIDKLNFLSNHIVETATLEDLVSVDNNEVRHLNFTFANLATQKNLKTKTITQGEVQPYLKKTQLYITKLHRYLNELKRNIDLIAQADFQMPSHLLPDPNDSTEANPLAWFEYLVTRYGLGYLRNYFKPSEDEIDYGNVSYDEETEIKTSEDQDPETGEWETSSEKFHDFLLNRLYKEYFKSRNLIEAVIIKKGTKKEIRLAFVLWFSKLVYLKNAVETEKQFKRYEMLPKPFDALIKFLYEKYPAFCPKPNSSTRTILEKAGTNKLKEPKTPTLPQTFHPGVFRWMKNDPFKNSTILHTQLNKVFIEDIALDDFHRAFTGAFPDNLNIRWIDKTTNELHFNKVTLLYLFKRLSETDLIDVNFDDPGMLRKLAFIFRDGDGKTLENLKQSKQGLLKAKKPQTYMKKEIDTVIKALLS